MLADVFLNAPNLEKETAKMERGQKHCRAAKFRTQKDIFGGEVLATPEHIKTVSMRRFGKSQGANEKRKKEKGKRKRKKKKEKEKRKRKIQAKERKEK